MKEKLKKGKPSVIRLFLLPGIIFMLLAFNDVNSPKKIFTKATATLSEKLQALPKAAIDTLPSPPVPKEPPPVPTAPVKQKLPKDVKAIKIKNDVAVVTFTNGKQQAYHLNTPTEKAAFQRKYGLPVPTTVEMTSPHSPGRIKVITPVPPVPLKQKLPKGVKTITIKNNLAEVILDNGKQETYDLNNPREKNNFEKKYGEYIPPEAPALPSGK